MSIAEEGKVEIIEEDMKASQEVIRKQKDEEKSDKESQTLVGI